MIPLCADDLFLINKVNRAFAYAITTQCISLFDNIYRYGANPEAAVLSKSTQTVIGILKIITITTLPSGI